MLLLLLLFLFFLARLCGGLFRLFPQGTRTTSALRSAAARRNFSGGSAPGTRGPPQTPSSSAASASSTPKPPNSPTASRSKAPSRRRRRRNPTRKAWTCKPPRSTPQLLPPCRPMPGVRGVQVLLRRKTRRLYSRRPSWKPRRSSTARPAPPRCSSPRSVKPPRREASRRKTRKPGPQGHHSRLGARLEVDHCHQRRRRRRLQGRRPANQNPKWHAKRHRETPLRPWPRLAPGSRRTKTKTRT
mmetsp:Transcript_40040/g.89788  ORF Transcript_40040/g.89788 Transcript_40040/m.89788 type:complete len:243 (-) Transcript_40040:327-1055(-)